MIQKFIQEKNSNELHSWIQETFKITIPARSVCQGHQAPWSFVSDLVLERPALALVLGPRGGGKSYLSALETHLTSQVYTGHGTRVLGGSLAQSEQIYQALRRLAREDQALAVLHSKSARYWNDSEVKILAASPTSVRGPHVPSLKLDEVDEIDPECRESALGMCMNRGRARASVLMTSTWHRLNGPMAMLMERSRAGEFPLYTFCIFEVLERCPEERSGPNLEKCVECPIVRWCHEDRDQDPLGRPKAKRSRGHYGIDALIQKARGVSVRTFEADYLCRGPKAEGLWFSTFDPVAHVSTMAEYDPAWPVHVAIDSGVFTGAVLFQVVHRQAASGTVDVIHVFADYLSEGLPAEQTARNVIEVARRHCGGRMDVVSTDPSGSSRTALGPTVLAEYERAGLRDLRQWPKGASVVDGLALVESFIQPAEGESRLIVHPRCSATIQGLMSYRRARRAGQWLDQPEDPQHPYEDLVDALRGGLRTCYPEGRSPRPALERVPAWRVF